MDRSLGGHIVGPCLPIVDLRNLSFRRELFRGEIFWWRSSYVGPILLKKLDCPIVLYRTGSRNPLIFYPPIDITNQRWYK